MDLSTVKTTLGAQGLVLRGGFHPAQSDDVPPLEDGRPVRTLVLAGNAGPAMWEVFSQSTELADGQLHPLDRWSERVLRDVAEQLGAHALFPFGGPPYMPFVAWAKRAEPVVESPLGMLIHPDYGLWHAYRGALAFAEELALPPRDVRPPPCDNCPERPCLTSCPVAAFRADVPYDVRACAHHIAAPAGTECMENACAARRACPAGRNYLYQPAQAQFHMRRFVESQRRAGILDNR